ncbi:accessory gene regulator ArgB-like protein [Paenibacillus koleovorans]|uniref:accessory gene regulator ArgB-like protein n=1 Tax=Paenibacillus koleovorans TaxID=121608 RepID=UPI000FD8BA36|nr:accessory gene regulator B family protein [Paenibacillus koleovorans]
MIENIAFRIASKIKTVDPDNTTSVDVMKYALIGLINSFLVFTFAFSFAILTNNFINTLLFSIGFIFLRSVSGGFHFSSSISCFIVSSAMAASVPHLQLSFELNLILNFISIIFVLLFAPSNIEGQTRIPKRYYPHLKYISIVIVIISLFITITPFTVGIFIQSCLLFRLEIFRRR